MQRLTNEEARSKFVEIAETFSPGAPIVKEQLFAGRRGELQKLINAVAQRGQHAIIFGPPGVGKTSLANIIGSHIPDALIAQQNCNEQTTFRPLWRSVLRGITKTTERPEAGFTSERKRIVSTLESELGDNVTPEDLRYIFSSLPKTVVILDEMNRLEDIQTKTLLADTIKTLSDHSVNTTVVIVGIAESVEKLITGHQSIERALVQIEMPRMSISELNEIIDRGLGRLSMTIEDTAKTLIVDLSQGLPHYTHLLTLHGAQTAVLDHTLHITRAHLDDAMQKAIFDAQQTIIKAYHKAILSPRANLFPQVLLSCALAPTDDLGYFSAADVRAPMKQITGKVYQIPAFAQHLKEFCEEQRGPILERIGYPRRYRFRFVNPLMEPYVILKGVADNWIKDTSGIGAHVAQRGLLY